MLNLLDIGLWAAFILVALLAIGLILTRLYRRTTKEVSFVRTGFGGQRVIMNGGALVFPVLHEVIQVNMNTLRLAVNRANEQALITRDRMRVDVVAEFYVRVQPTADSIANAAQTLGLRTTQPERLKELVEGKFVDALRSVAAEMSMEELHEKRVDFVQKVQQVVSEDLLKNGLELETVSLTGLDQTSMEFFNPNNAFDAEGLTRLTEEIETRNKLRNDIEQDTAVQIKNKNLEAERKKLEIAKEEEYARLEQQREIEVRRAGQAADIAKEQADKRQDSENATIRANQQVEQTRIAAERAVEEERIEKARLIDIRTVEKERALKLADQERQIAIEEKSKEESVAKAAADEARARATEAEEQIETARAREIAGRDKQIELIEAAKNAEREAIRIKVAAEAEKEAAVDLASARREEAQGEADKMRITAEAESEAERLRAAAARGYLCHPGRRPEVTERGCQHAFERTGQHEGEARHDPQSGGHCARERQADGQHRQHQDPAGRWAKRVGLVQADRMATAPAAMAAVPALPTTSSTAHSGIARRRRWSMPCSRRSVLTEPIWMELPEWSPARWTAIPARTPSPRPSHHRGARANRGPGHPGPAVLAKPTREPD